MYSFDKFQYCIFMVEDHKVIFDHLLSVSIPDFIQKTKNQIQIETIPLVS